VGDLASVGGGASIKKTYDCVVVGPIGSRDSYTTFYKKENSTLVICGCFSGTVEEFIDKVRSTHDDKSPHRNAYLAAVDYATRIINGGTNV
jgi:hypothetical protein